MKRLTATLAALTVAVAVSAPTAFAAHSPAAKANHKRIGQRQVVHPGQKLAKKAIAVRGNKKLSVVSF